MIKHPVPNMYGINSTRLILGFFMVHVLLSDTGPCADPNPLAGKAPLCVRAGVCVYAHHTVTTCSETEPGD